jgi:hypothetical protein
MGFLLLYPYHLEQFRLDGSYGRQYSWEVLDSFFSVKCVSEINMMSNVMNEDKCFQFFCMLCQAIGVLQGKL